MQIRHELVGLSRLGKKILFFWVPAHVVIQGNDQVDTLAKRAIREGLVTRILIPKRDFDEKWKSEQFSEFDKWSRKEGEVKGKYYFDHFYSDSRVPFQILEQEKYRCHE